MKSKRINIIILSLFLTVVFVAPITIKGTHHHVVKQELFLYPNHNKVLSKTEQACPICHFEFITFYTHSIEQYFFPFPTISLKESKLVSQEYKTSFTYFSHRAPPLA